MKIRIVSVQHGVGLDVQPATKRDFCWGMETHDRALMSRVEQMVDLH